jgi:hypothetical protein
MWLDTSSRFELTPAVHTKCELTQRKPGSPHPSVGPVVAPPGALALEVGGCQPSRRVLGFLWRDPANVDRFAAEEPAASSPQHRHRDW